MHLSVIITFTSTQPTLLPITNTMSLLEMADHWSYKWKSQHQVQITTATPFKDHPISFVREKKKTWSLPLLDSLRGYSRESTSLLNALYTVVMVVMIMYVY